MENELENPSYYGILPANVRYDQDVSSSAKLLYAEISALANMRGICWATNKYFAELYKVNKTTISAWVKQLETKGFIRTKTIAGGYRGISVVATPSEKAEGGVRKKPNHNNTVTNNSIVENEKSLLLLVNKITGRNFRVFGTKSGVKKTLDTFTLVEIESALTALARDPWHRPKLKELSIDYFIRSTTIDRFLDTKATSGDKVGDAYGFLNGKKIITEDEDGNYYWGGELITPQNEERVMEEQDAQG